MKTPVLALSLFLLFFFAAAENSLACSCVPEDKNTSLNQKVRDAYKNSAAVFAGRIVSLADSQDSRFVIVTIQVVDVWKGNIPASFQIFTNKGRDACEFPFAVGSDYLIYGVIDSGNLSTNICLRTNFFANNQDIAILNKIVRRTP